LSLVFLFIEQWLLLQSLSNLSPWQLSTISHIVNNFIEALFLVSLNPSKILVSHLTVQVPPLRQVSRPRRNSLLLELSLRTWEIPKTPDQVSLFSSWSFRLSFEKSYKQSFFQKKWNTYKTFSKYIIFILKSVFHFIIFLTPLNLYDSRALKPKICKLDNLNIISDLKIKNV